MVFKPEFKALFSRDSASTFLHACFLEVWFFHLCSPVLHTQRRASALTSTLTRTMTSEGESACRFTAGSGGRKDSVSGDAVKTRECSTDGAVSSSAGPSVSRRPFDHGGEVSSCWEERGAASSSGGFDGRVVGAASLAVVELMVEEESTSWRVLVLLGNVVRRVSSVTVEMFGSCSSEEPPAPLVAPSASETSAEVVMTSLSRVLVWVEVLTQEEVLEEL